MNLDYRTYAATVKSIVSGNFDENGNYIPEFGKGNILRIYCMAVTKNEEAKKLNFDEIGAFEYIDKCMELVGGEFAEALKDNDYFSFGGAVKDAEKVINFRLEKLSHESKFESALEAVIQKVNELDKNVNPEDITKMIELLKEQKPFDENAIVSEYLKHKEENADGEKREPK